MHAKLALVMQHKGYISIDYISGVPLLAKMSAAAGCYLEEENAYLG